MPRRRFGEKELNSSGSNLETNVLLDIELSTPAEIRLPLLWLAILHGRVPASLAASQAPA
jgi:hypothetical protein